jgi:hypothetical protein
MEDGEERGLRILNQEYRNRGKDQFLLSWFPYLMAFGVWRLGFRLSVLTFESLSASAFRLF